MNVTSAAPPKEEPKRILALDLGIGSYGIALQTREGEGEHRQYSFPLVRSCILPGDWAELKDERTRRRMWKTRLAHKAREKWLREVFENCGMKDAILWGRRLVQVKTKTLGTADGQIEKTRWTADPSNPPDYRLEREFPPAIGSSPKDAAPSDAQGSRTVYAGAALRCLLLMGEEAQRNVQGCTLAPWQIFKALHSAIQKRGYDANVPWATQRTPKPGAPPEAANKKGGNRKSAHEAASPNDNDASGGLSEDEIRDQKEEQASLERALTMKSIVQGLSDDSLFQHPCFWEAWRMGLWEPSAPSVIHLRQTHHARSCKWADVDDPAQKSMDASQRALVQKLPVALRPKLPAIFPREMVEGELLALCEAAARQLPQLSARSHEIVYGPVGVAYPTIPRRGDANEELETRRRDGLAALPDTLRKKFVRGKEAEWQGALAQKAPTFDNRGPGACALIPRFNVAKCDLRYVEGKLAPESALASEVSFLLQAKNFRFAPEIPDSTKPAGYRDSFSSTELKKLFDDHFTQTVLPRIQAGNRDNAMIQNKRNLLTRWLEDNIGPDTGPKAGLEEKGKAAIETPKPSGRSRFSRPALRLIKELLLSGLSPAAFKASLLDINESRWDELRQGIKLVATSGKSLNADPMKGMVAGDLDFLDNIGTSWDKISIRDERLEVISECAKADDAAGRQDAITRMISMEVNPKIRHRLTLLDKLLDEVVTVHGTPDRVVMEFAREEWMGPKRRKELMDFQNERKQQNITARINLGGNVRPEVILKHQLYEEQQKHCLFCGRNFSSPETGHVANGELSFHNAQLAHIVADSMGGPRAYVNLILACESCNRAQGGLYHSDAFTQRLFPRGWDSFVSDLQGLPSMRPFKKKILSTKSVEEAATMVQNKTALQETAWIAKLARVLVSLKFGWRLDSEGEQRRVVVVTGSVTNRVATKYGLYSLLGGPERVKKLADARADITQALVAVDTASEDSLQEVGDKLEKTLKLKKRKGDDEWDREHMQRFLYRLKITNDDAINEKDRDDDRHHALDAMILSFLPHWSANPGKSLYFGLPKLPKGRDWKSEFHHYLAPLYPEVLISARPELEESFYGARRKEASSAATKRYVLREIAYSGINPKFSDSTLSKRAANIYDQNIRSAVLTFIGSKPNEEDWLNYCDKLARVGIRAGGPPVVSVRCIVSDQLTEYADFSKDNTGAWRRGDKNQGWFVCEKKNKEGEFAVEPVYVHQSRKGREAQLLRDGAYKRIVGYFVRDEVVDLFGDVDWIGEPIRAGSYVIRGMRLDGQVYLATNEGHAFKPTSITNLMSVGLQKRFSV